MTCARSNHQPAERDLDRIAVGWAENRSTEQAGRWYRRIRAKIRRLNRTHRQCSLAPENDLIAQELRQLLFGLGRRPTHRVLYVVDGDEVVVLRIRHASQRPLVADDLSAD